MAGKVGFEGVLALGVGISSSYVFGTFGYWYGYLGIPIAIFFLISFLLWEEKE